MEKRKRSQEKKVMDELMDSKTSTPVKPTKFRRSSSVFDLQIDPDLIQPRGFQLVQRNRCKLPLLTDADRPTTSGIQGARRTDADRTDRPSTTGVQGARRTDADRTDRPSTSSSLSIAQLEKMMKNYKEECDKKMEELKNDLRDCLRDLATLRMRVNIMSRPTPAPATAAASALVVPQRNQDLVADEEGMVPLYPGCPVLIS